MISLSPLSPSLPLSQSVDFEFQMISLTGRTFLAASGDGGVGCTDLGYGPGYYNCSYFNANFPTSAPHVVSVGATTTSTSPEQNWARSSGGFSDLYDQPSYQGDAVARFCFFFFVFFLLYFVFVFVFVFCFLFFFFFFFFFFFSFSFSFSFFSN